MSFNGRLCLVAFTKPFVWALKRDLKSGENLYTILYLFRKKEYKRKTLNLLISESAELTIHQADLGEPPETRTQNLFLKRELLYQLS